MEVAAKPSSDVSLTTLRATPALQPGVIGAKNATLTIMVGSSSQEPFDRAKPLLQTMGKKVLRCGGLGAGLAAKISNK
jgi:3-hydroxyisobutyrate dehydrogenase